MANVIKHKRGSGSDPAANNLVLGELAIRTDTGKLFTKMDSGAIAEIAGGGSDIAINTLSSSSATGGGSATFNGSAYRFTLSAPPNVSAAQLLVSINGVIQKPVAGTGQPSEGFSVDGTDIILGDAPATGSDFFILTFKSLGVSEPADNSVTSAKIVDGTIVNADINASAAIAGSKISPSFTSDLTITDVSPAINFTDSNNDSDFRIIVNDGKIKIQDTTNSNAVRFLVDSSGNIGIGTTSPDSLLDVVNTGGAAEIIVSSSTQPRLMLKTSGTTAECRVDFGDSGDSSRGAIGYNHSDDALKFYTTGVANERMRIDSSGTVLLSGSRSGNSISDATLRFNIVNSNGDEKKAQIISTKVADVSSTIEFGTTVSHSYAERMRIHSNGFVGIGTAAPVRRLHLHNDSSTSNYLQVTNSTTGSSSTDGVLFGLNSSEDGLMWNFESKKLKFATANTERMIIDSSGNVGINTASPSAKLQVSGGHINIDSGYSYQWGDSHERIEQSDGKIEFFTNNTEKMTLSGSNLGIGTTSPNRTIHTHVNDSGANYHQFTNSACGTADSDGSFVGIDSGEDLIVWNQEVNAIRFATSNTERMRISSDGKVRIGAVATDAAGKFQVVEEGGGNQSNDCNAYFETNANDWNIKTYYNSSGTHYHMAFIEQGSFRGRIQGNDGSNVQYLAGSDYRWKENIVDLSGSEGIDICKKLKPRKYNWIENREETGQINTVDGFIAHEVEEAGVLGAVTGKKDAVNEDGSIDGQMLDYGQMTPVLAAAIKGLIARVEALEAK